MSEQYEALEIHVQAATGDVYPVVAKGDGDATFLGSIPREVVRGLDTDYWLRNAAHDEAYLRNLGSQLFCALFTKEILRAFVSGLAAAEAKGLGLRLLLTLDPPELARLPWELIYAQEHGGFIARSATTPLVRHLSTPHRARSPIRDDALRVLVAVAEPENYVPLAAARDEIRAIARALSGEQVWVDVPESSAPGALAGVRKRAAAALRVLSGKGEQVRVKLLEHATRSRLKNALREAERAGQGYHVVHFIGHGASDDSGGQLIFEDETGAGVRVPAEQVAELLERTSVNLVFLNACASAREGDANRPFYPFRGVAQACIDKGILAALAMQVDVLDSAAARFASEFYASLADGEEVEKAVLDARQLMAEGQAADWVVPVLYSRVTRGPILVYPPPGASRSWWHRLRASAWVFGPRQVMVMMFGVISALALLLGFSLDIQTARQPGGVLSSVWPAATATATPVPPMPGGFNVAVAQFTTLDSTGQLSVTEDSRALSDWLYGAIVAERDRLPAAIGFNLRGPGEVGAVPGIDREAREANAELLAHDHNATMLIYGVITSGQNGYQVEPEFYVSEEGYRYGNEIEGPNRLGRAVPYQPPLDDPAKFAVNDKLSGRTTALRHLVAGLANYHVALYDDAWADFRQASLVPSWRAEEGKEVVYLLMGAVRLRQYDTESADIRHLSEALDAFAEARRLNPDYARSYLGLGGVALLQAVRDEETGPDEEKLAEARGWYLASLDAADQPASVYVPVRAYFGLAQVYLKGYERGRPGWSAEEARGYLQRVVDAYEQGHDPDLVWFAGRALALLGRIALYSEDWAGMSEACRQAIDLLNTIPGTSEQSTVAEYWTWVAFAEEKAGHPDIARDAFWQAIQVGQGIVPSGTLDTWQKELERLEKGSS